MMIESYALDHFQWPSCPARFVDNGIEFHKPAHPHQHTVTMPNNIFTTDSFRSFNITWSFLDAISISTVGCVTHVTSHHGFWYREGLNQEGSKQEGLKQEGLNKEG